MKESILVNLVYIRQNAEVASQLHKDGKDQQILELANDIRNLAWSIKEEIFKTRLLDQKISDKGSNSVKLMARARHVSTSLDDLLDLL